MQKRGRKRTKNRDVVAQNKPRSQLFGELAPWRIQRRGLVVLFSNDFLYNVLGSILIPFKLEGKGASCLGNTA